MTMATYYNMNQSSTDCSLCPAPIHQWNDRETLWEFWLKKPQTDGVAAGVMSAGVGQMVKGGCGCKNGTTKSCCAPGGKFDYPAIGSHGLTDKLAAARAYGGCHGYGCPGQVCLLPPHCLSTASPNPPRPFRLTKRGRCFVCFAVLLLDAGRPPSLR